MKKIILLLSTLFAVGTIGSACDQDDSEKPDFQKLLTRKQITVIPEQLIVAHGTVPVDFQVVIPARFLPRKALLTLTPTLLCGVKEYKSIANTWQGEGVVGENPIVAYDQPTTVTLHEAFPYNNTMKEYELFLEVNIIDGYLTSFRVPISKGIFPSPQS